MDQGKKKIVSLLSLKFGLHLSIEALLSCLVFAFWGKNANRQNCFLMVLCSGRPFFFTVLLVGHDLGRFSLFLQLIFKRIVIICAPGEPSVLAHILYWRCVFFFYLFLMRNFLLEAAKRKGWKGKNSGMRLGGKKIKKKK